VDDARQGDGGFGGEAAAERRGQRRHARKVELALDVEGMIELRAAKCRLAELNGEVAEFFDGLS
jgi:hypothetical protein